MSVSDSTGSKEYASDITNGWMDGIDTCLLQRLVVAELPCHSSTPVTMQANSLSFHLDISRRTENMTHPDGASARRSSGNPAEKPLRVGCGARWDVLLMLPNRSFLFERLSKTFSGCGPRKGPAELGSDAARPLNFKVRLPGPALPEPESRFLQLHNIFLQGP
eukprot:837730-Rhodomonas_salina.1